MSQRLTEPSSRGAFLGGVCFALGAWTSLFASFGPVPPRSALFDKLGLSAFGLVTALVFVAVLSGKTVWGYRFLVAGLTTVVALWHFETPSTTDGFSGAHTIVAVVIAVLCLALVVAVDNIRDFILDIKE